MLPANGLTTPVSVFTPIAVPPFLVGLKTSAGLMWQSTTLTQLAVGLRAGRDQVRGASDPAYNFPETILESIISVASGTGHWVPSDTWAALLQALRQIQALWDAVFSAIASRGFINHGNSPSVSDFDFLRRAANELKPLIGAAMARFDFRLAALLQLILADILFQLAARWKRVFLENPAPTPDAAFLLRRS